jgi:hypothetical protein
MPRDSLKLEPKSRTGPSPGHDDSVSGRLSSEAKAFEHAARPNVFGITLGAHCLVPSRTESVTHYERSRCGAVTPRAVLTPEIETELALGRLEIIHIPVSEPCAAVILDCEYVQDAGLLTAPIEQRLKMSRRGVSCPEVMHGEIEHQ